MAGAVRSLDSRWIRRYRLFFIIGSIILSIQVFLAYKFFSIEPSDNQNGLDRYDPSWRDKVIVIESPGRNEDPNGAASSRRIKDDDDDSPSNSVNSMYNKHKVPPDKNVDVQQSELGKSSASNRTNLRLDELDFVPLCDIAAKEAVSAIHRAKTQRCKQLLANVTCLIQSGKLYPTQLPNTCPAPGLTAGKSLGCFQDDKTFRLLSGYYAKLATTNTPEQCINMCLQSGFPYAGVEYSLQCFCGAEQPASTARLPDSSCNMKCSGDAKQVCGGFLAVGVYQTGVAKFTAQVAQDVAPSNETRARVVFLLTLNGRAVRQVRRLVKMLYHRDHFFFIHVDARQDYMFRELLPLERTLPNVRVSRSRSATIWGGASLLQMLLRSMDQLLSLDWPWDFIINLSESDLPVKTNDALVEFLTANKRRNFVKSHGREVQRFIQKQGLDKTFLECDQHMWRIGTRALPWGVTMDGGSDWMALSRPFVAFVARRNELVQRLLIIFEYTLLPAESFFHTVLRNTEFCDSYVDNNLHVTNWKRRLGCKCQYKHVVDWCGCSPNDFKLDDWPRIQATEVRQLFFARKFEPVVDQSVIHRVDEWLYGPYPPNVVNVDSYWQSVHHHADLSPAPDDAVVTLAWSLARRNLKTARLGGARVAALLEVTSFYERDMYRGALVRYEVDLRDGTQPLVLETWTQYRADTAFADGANEASFKSLVVSSEFDVKEQMCHNAMNALGPFSEPVLVVATQPIELAPFNVTLLWVDPIGRVVDVQEMHLDPASGLLSTSKALLLSPLLPGIWEVKLVQANAVRASTRFLVTPLYNVNKQTVGLVHKNLSPPHASAADWDGFLANQSQRDVKLRGAELNARRVGEDLEEWIDALSTKFHVIKASCVSETEALGLEPCQRTSWSSLASDPKSHIGGTNATSGRLLR